MRGWKRASTTHLGRKRSNCTRIWYWTQTGKSFTMPRKDQEPGPVKPNSLTNLRTSRIRAAAIMSTELCWTHTTFPPLHPQDKGIFSPYLQDLPPFIPFAHSQQKETRGGGCTAIRPTFQNLFPGLRSHSSSVHHSSILVWSKNSNSFLPSVCFLSRDLFEQRGLSRR